MRTTEHAPDTVPRVRLRKVRLEVVSGVNAGRVLQAEVDVVRIGAHPSNDLVLDDRKVSRRHALLRRTQRGVVLRDLDSTNGTWIGTARIEEVVLVGEQTFSVGGTVIRFVPADEEVEVRPSVSSRFDQLVGSSVAMREVFSILERVAPTELNVLVTGETGTGKELVSRALHSRSRRRDGPLVVFDCGATPENLIESELFGHEKGAFTGAVEARPGVFEQAHGGTLFLDELGELAPQLQPKLLRVLERREVRRVGGRQVHRVDVRVVAATNRDLAVEVAAGRFRSDLYYRLAVVEVALPPLRERLEDLPLLVDHVLEQAAVEGLARKRVSEEVLEVLRGWHWPGNVRELRNVVMSALPFSDGPEIRVAVLPSALRRGERPPVGKMLDMPSNPTYREARNELMDAFERAYVRDLMERCEGQLARAARVSGMDRRTLQRMLRTHDLLELVAKPGEPRT